MKYLPVLLALVMLVSGPLILVSSCSDAKLAALKSNGKKHRVKAYSGGQLIGEWVSSGKILNEENSDGYYFMDDATSKMVTVSGDVIITTE